MTCVFWPIRLCTLVLGIISSLLCSPDIPLSLSFPQCLEKAVRHSCLASHLCSESYPLVGMGNVRLSQSGWFITAWSVFMSFTFPWRPTSLVLTMIFFLNIRIIFGLNKNLKQNICGDKTRNCIWSYSRPHLNWLFADKHTSEADFQ